MPSNMARDSTKFRSRKLDSRRPLPVYRASQLRDLDDATSLARATTEMTTGVDKEEEKELHLQAAMTSFSETATNAAIPTPDANETIGDDEYVKLYPVLPILGAPSAPPPLISPSASSKANSKAPSPTASTSGEGAGVAAAMAPDASATAGDTASAASVKGAGAGGSTHSGSNYLPRSLIRYSATLEDALGCAHNLDSLDASWLAAFRAAFQVECERLGPPPVRRADGAKNANGTGAHADSTPPTGTQEAAASAPPTRKKSRTKSPGPSKVGSPKRNGLAKGSKSATTSPPHGPTVATVIQPNLTVDAAERVMHVLEVLMTERVGWMLATPGFENEVVLAEPMTVEEALESLRIRPDLAGPISPGSSPIRTSVPSLPLATAAAAASATSDALSVPLPPPLAVTLEGEDTATGTPEVVVKSEPDEPATPKKKRRKDPILEVQEKSKKESDKEAVAGTKDVKSPQAIAIDGKRATLIVAQAETFGKACGARAAKHTHAYSDKAPSSDAPFHIQTAWWLPHVFPWWQARRIHRDNKPVEPVVRVEEPTMRNEVDPYVCFRKRELKMARKTRRTDTQAIQALRKLRTEFEVGRLLVRQVHAREIARAEHLQADRAVFEGRVKLREAKRKHNIAEEREWERPDYVLPTPTKRAQERAAERAAAAAAAAQAQAAAVAAAHAAAPPAHHTARAHKSEAAAARSRGSRGGAHAHAHSHHASQGAAAPLTVPRMAPPADDLPSLTELQNRRIEEEFRRRKAAEEAYEDVSLCPRNVFAAGAPPPTPISPGGSVVGTNAHSSAAASANGSLAVSRGGSGANTPPSASPAVPTIAATAAAGAPAPGPKRAAGTTPPATPTARQFPVGAPQPISGAMFMPMPAMAHPLVVYSPVWRTYAMYPIAPHAQGLGAIYGASRSPLAPMGVGGMYTAVPPVMYTGFAYAAAPNSMGHLQPQHQAQQDAELGVSKKPGKDLHSTYMHVPYSMRHPAVPDAPAPAPESKAVANESNGTHGEPMAIVPDGTPTKYMASGKKQAPPSPSSSPIVLESMAPASPEPLGIKLRDTNGDMVVECDGLAPEGKAFVDRARGIASPPPLSPTSVFDAAGSASGGSGDEHHHLQKQHALDDGNSRKFGAGNKALPPSPSVVAVAGNGLPIDCDSKSTACGAGTPSSAPDMRFVFRKRVGRGGRVFVDRRCRPRRENPSPSQLALAVRLASAPMPMLMMAQQPPPPPVPSLARPSLA